MNFLERFRHVITAEAEAIRSLPIEELQTPLQLLAQMLLDCKGKVVTCGMGKNGHIAKRVAATLSCTGTASCFMHPGESSHGDLGMLSESDILLALSNSGKTREILETVERVRRYYPHVVVVVVTGNPYSPLAHHADLALSYGEIQEPCPLGLTPSASLAVMSALLDALALGVMELRGFTKEHFLVNHNYGSLGDKLRDEYAK
jgi:arabinose-5-phosphate isomerase